MKRLFLLLLSVFVLATPVVVHAQAAAAPAANTADSTEHANTTAAAAATKVNKVHEPKAPDFLEHLVDAVLDLFNVQSSENTTTHYVVSAVLLIGAFVLRRVVTTLLFGQLRRLASRTKTTLDDKLLPALEAPAAAFIVLVGIFGALKVLKMSESSDLYIGYGSTIAFSLVIFWALLRAFNAVLDHAQELATRRQMGVAAFMPWIKKTLITIFVVFGVLMVVQSLGYDVKALLAGLGIGGLAFALAAQDTLANLFGSVVVAIDQPFKLGEAVKIGASEGVVEDIGLRSTKLRTPGQNLIVIPNKTVAAEPIINNSRFIQRRIEQVIGLTYDTTPEQMEAIVEDIRQLILHEEEVDKSSVMVFFRDFNPSSLDLWVVYNSKDPDFQKHMRLRQRINLAMMRAILARELAFAFPTQTTHVVDPAVAKPAAERKS